MSDRPRVLLFTGDGKGKTTAALGMALRAAGHGLRVLIVQFVKGDPETGENRAVTLLPGVELRQRGLGFIPRPTAASFAAHREAAINALREAAEALASGHHDLVVLDEVCVAVAKGLLGEQAVCEAVNKARAGTCVVLTGRGATPALIDLADTVTDMRCVKHAFEAGRRAQTGVEG